MKAKTRRLWNFVEVTIILGVISTIAGAIVGKIEYNKAHPSALSAAASALLRNRR